MSMISTGWPWPAAMFRSRPSAIKWIRFPSGKTYSSTNSRTFFLVFERRSRSALEISLSKWPALPRTTRSLRRGKWAAVRTSLPPVAEMMKSAIRDALDIRSEEHTSELQSLRHLVCRLLLEKKKYNDRIKAAYIIVDIYLVYLASTHTKFPHHTT